MGIGRPKTEPVFNPSEPVEFIEKFIKIHKERNGKVDLNSHQKAAIVLYKMLTADPEPTVMKKKVVSVNGKKHIYHWLAKGKSKEPNIDHDGIRFIIQYALGNI